MGLELAPDARRWDVVFASALDLLILFSREGRFLYVSPNVGQILGFAREELVEHTGSDFLHPDDKDVIQAAHSRICSVPGATQISRFRLRCKDGHYRWVEAVITNRFDDPDFRALVVNVHPTADVGGIAVREGEHALPLLRIQSGLAIALVGAQTLVEIAELTCSATRKIHDVDIAGLYVVEEITGDLVLAHADGGSAEFVEKTRRFPKGSPRIAWLSTIDPYHGRVLSLPELGITGDEIAHEGASALSIVPLCHRGRLYGCLNIVSRTTTSLSQDVRATLEAIGAICAKALAELDAHVAARESTRRYAELFERMEQGALYQGADGRIMSANPACARILGVPRDELRSRTLSSFEMTREDGSPLPAEDRPFERALRTGEAQRATQIRLVSATGEPRWIVIDTHPSFAGGEQVVGAHSVITDVTDRRRATDALVAKVREYDALVHASHDGFIVLGPDNRILQVDETFSVMAQRSSAALVGTLAIDVIAPGSRKDAARGLAEVRVAGFARADVGLLRVDGTVIPTETTGWRAPASDNVVVCVRDVTEQKRAQAKIAEHEQRYRSIVKGALDAFLACDRTGRIIDVNAAATTVFGYPREQLLGMSMPDIDPTFAERIVPFTKGVGAIRFETVARSGSGEPIDIEVSAWASEEHGIFLAFARDLTAQRRAERELHRSQEQLVQAQKMEAIGRLAGGVAHDFNNLLTVINTSTELALDALHATDPLREELQEIANAGKRAAGLTRQLLTFSRRHIVQASVVDVDDVIGDLERMLRRIIGEDITLEVRRASTAPLVFADRGQLEQVVVNLVVNARDAMPSGGWLRIETAVRGSEPGELAASLPCVVISVVDNGCGMDGTTLAHIFEPFFTTKGQAGTGLGLSTVYGVVKQSGGHVRVSSTVGSGTQFDVLLPLTTAASADVPPAREARVAAHAGETILLVEDEPSVRNLVREVLTRVGYIVLAAANGDEALDISKGHGGEIHLLFTDLVMPRMNGRELAERVRALRPRIKVIFSSGYSDDVLTRQGMNEPGVHFLQKPLSVARLRENVRSVLDS